MAEEQEPTEAVQENVADGDILKLMWKGRSENSDKIVDQMDSTVVVVGKSDVIAGIEEILPEMKPGETKTIEVPPEKGYGKRDPSQVQIMSLRKFKKQNINPQPGMQLRVQNRIAMIRRVHGGRVTVDFNHPLAGKTLMYEVTIEAILSDPSDIIRALIKKHLPQSDPAEFTIKIEDEVVIIHLPKDESIVFKQDIQFFKVFISSEVITNLEEISSVQFVETFPIESEETQEPSDD